jgi:hypothetical protein
MFRLLQNYREFASGLIGLLLVLGVILAFGAAGWPGDVNTCFRSPGNCYCENIDQNHPENSAILRDPGMFAQPVNTWSNVGFMLVGLAMLWWIGWERTTGRRAPLRNRITDGTLFATLYGGFTVFLGPGSMFFHASMRQWAGWFDVMSMNFFLAFVPAYNLVRRFAWPNWAGILIYFAAVVIEGVLVLVDPDDSLIFFAALGAIAIASQIVVACSSGIHTATSGKVWFGVGVGVFALAFVIWWLSWTNGPLCDPASPLQGHGAWHLLSAAAVGCLYMYFRAEEGEKKS